MEKHVEAMLEMYEFEGMSPGRFTNNLHTGNYLIIKDVIVHSDGSILWKCWARAYGEVWN